MFCDRCGTPLVSGAQFCASCGKAVVARAVPPAIPAVAWGLFERQSWARILGLVLGILALLRFPLGTALGIYTLWVLAPEPSAREYDQLSHPGGQTDSAGFSATPR